MDNVGGRHGISGRVGVMSYRDLPPDLGAIPLTDPTTAADVVDLILEPASREAGCIGLMLCTADGHGISPVVIDQIPDDVPVRDVATSLRRVLEVVAESDGCVLAARGRPGTFLLTDEDRAWHEAMIAVCRDTGVRLLGAYVATMSTVRGLPEPLGEAAS